MNATITHSLEKEKSIDATASHGSSEQRFYLASVKNAQPGAIVITLAPGTQ